MGKLTIPQSRELLKNVNPLYRYSSRLEYLLLLTAIEKVYKDDLLKSNGKGRAKKKTLGQVIEHMKLPKNIEYLCNGMRYRARSGIEEGRLAVGTAGNEGLHYDLCSWFRGVGLHEQTLSTAATKVRAWILSQAVPHFIAQNFHDQSGYAARDVYLQRIITEVLRGFVRPQDKLGLPAGDASSRTLRTGRQQLASGLSLNTVVVPAKRPQDHDANQTEAKSKFPRFITQYDAGKKAASSSTRA